MERRIPKEDIHKIKWTDLGNHAYHHWLHERGFAPEFDELCYKSADIILDKLYNKEPLLFRWPKSDIKEPFSRVCQGTTRYPKII